MAKNETPTLAEAYGYLDMLRESSVTNMFGAGAYLERDLGMTRVEARTVLQRWKATTPEERAAISLERKQP